MLYADVHDWLGWPTRDQAFKPSGAGVRVYADFARKKIQRGIEAVHPGTIVDVGVIAPDPTSSDTDQPLAVVCEFPRGATDEVLELTQKFAWNFSRAALLITLEPHRLIAWSCLQDPSRPTEDRIVCQLPTPAHFSPDGSQTQREVRDLLHWVNLINHRVQRERPQQFPASGRADVLLIQNLRYVRRRLRDDLKLAQEHCHDLLARLIFTQFLFHRKDSEGNAFFSERKMKRLQEDGVLKKFHSSLASVLTHKGDTYDLFRWMDERFNGDLFPGKDAQDSPEGHGTWSQEKQAVKKEHLDLLAGFVSGDLDAASQQQLLWPHYSFDTIPLEFISSVYEEFLTPGERHGDKAYYTPSHLVDYVLDAVLPWNSKNWDIKILDPCCGSAIFLVKAFQRLIHRWRLANKREPLVSDLRPILENNLVGIDKNPEAVRVACFSLYLAMADAIEPKHYITRDRTKVFPHLRGTRLIHGDFFDEEVDGINSESDSASYDLVIGNAPWGDGSIFLEQEPDETNQDYKIRKKKEHSHAQVWARIHKWPVANNDLGPVFLAKSGHLAKPRGHVAMINTASILYWRANPAKLLRRKIFEEFTFEEVTNLTALRRDLFAEAIGPACIAVFQPSQPARGSSFFYYTPKPAFRSSGDAGVETGIVVEPYQITQIHHSRAAEDPWVWSALSAGGDRQLLLLERLREHKTLESLEAEGAVLTRKGVISGDEKQAFPGLSDAPILAAPSFPEDVFLEIDAATLPLWERPLAHSGDSVDFDAFENPQILIKQSYVAKLGRLRAALVRPLPRQPKTICREAYVSCRDLSPDGRHIKSACAAYNSRFAVFFFAMTSGSFPHYISKISVEELLKLPLPHASPDLAAIDSFDALDGLGRTMYGLTDADWAIIDDFVELTLPDLLKKTPGPARARTRRSTASNETEPDLTSYTETFIKIVGNTFRKPVSATLFADQNSPGLPVRAITIHLGREDTEGTSLEEIESDGLLDELSRLHADQLEKQGRGAAGGLGFQRIAYFFHPGREGGKKFMNLTIVKPDERRYWTRSMAMRDADQLAGSIATAAGKGKGK